MLQVKMDAAGNVSESNENNTFTVHVTVQYDCNGDGVIAGAGPKITATPARPAASTIPALKRGAIRDKRAATTAAPGTGRFGE